MTNSEVLRQCKVILEQSYRSRFKGLILYGSMARNQAGLDSDIDLLVLLSPPFILTLSSRGHVGSGWGPDSQSGGPEGCGRRDLYGRVATGVSPAGVTRHRPDPGDAGQPPDGHMPSGVALDRGAPTQGRVEAVVVIVGQVSIQGRLKFLQRIKGAPPEQLAV